jgi:hypothetical protein
MSDRRVVGVCQAIVRSLPLVRGGAAWINRGPLPLDQTSMEAVLQALQKYWVGQRGHYLRVAPPLYAVDPDVPHGYRFTAVRGWSSARVNLEAEVVELRKRLHQKWRNCLNKAERFELTVAISSEHRAFERFIDGYRRMLEEKDLVTSVTPELLLRLQALLPEDRRMHVLRADAAAGRTVGMMLVVRYGQTGEYLAGTIEDEGRAMNAGHLLLWNALIHLKSSGCRWFDLGGADPERTPQGILHFKEGIGGEPYSLIREIESDDGRWITRAIGARVRRQRGN